MGGGESVYLKFGWESTFKTEATTINKTFGEDPVVKSLDLRNNIKRLFRLGGRNAVNLLANKFEGALGIEFELADPWWIKGLLGQLTTAGAGPYTQTYAEANLPPSMTIENGIDLTTDAIRKYLGAIIADAKITASVGDEPAHVALTVLYANETKATTPLGSMVAPTDPVYPFAMGSFEYPTGTAIADMDSVSISISNSAAMKHALGSRIASRYTMRQRLYDASVVNYFDDAASYLAKFYGQATGPQTVTLPEDAGCKLILSNGGAGAALRKYEVTFTGCIIEHHSLPQQVAEELMETADIVARTCGIVCTNNTAAEP